jgi:uncharacterized SAM-binding protein YcdF (DUF218 family)
MEPAFLLKKLAAVILLPPLGPLLLIAAGLLLWRRRPTAGKLLAWSGLAAALALSLPTSVSWLVEPLERTPVLDPARAAEAQAIVILAGGKRRHAPEYGGESVNRLTLERLRYGAKLARRTGLPVLVAGGLPIEGDSEAHLMRIALEEDFGVPVRWTESASRDTRENAVNSARILRDAGVRKVLLVSHAIHLPRAQAEFEAAGMEVIPAPTAFLHGPYSSEMVLAKFPSANSAYAGWLATHEWLGNLARFLTATRP